MIIPREESRKIFPWQNHGIFPTFMWTSVGPPPQPTALAPTKYAMNSNVLALLKRCYRITDRYDKEQICLADYSKHAALWRRSFDRQCVPSCSYGLRHKATLFVHTVLQFWSIPNLVVRTFSPPVPCVHSSRAHPRRVSMPSCNDRLYYKKNDRLKNIFRCI